MEDVSRDRDLSAGRLSISFQMGTSTHPIKACQGLWGLHRGEPEGIWQELGDHWSMAQSFLSWTLSLSSWTALPRPPAQPSILA